MLMSVLWTCLIGAAVLYGAASGNAEAVGNAAMDGAAGALKFIIETGGAICLWCGVIEVMDRCGISGTLSRLLKPILKRLFPAASKHEEIIDAISSNCSANLLGLGNAATPMGIRAAKGLAGLSSDGIASDELCMLVVLNSASIQLLPTTVAAVRASCGAASPFDILPCVWISSVISVTAGLTSSYIFSKIL